MILGALLMEFQKRNMIRKEILHMNRIKSIKPMTDNKFLNLFNFEVEDKKGNVHPYYVASRHKENEMPAAGAEVKPDAVLIYAYYGEKRDKLVLIRQYRYPVGDYIYELPAGLVDDGENVVETAIREMKEETGLDFEPIPDQEVFNRSCFSSAGMTDETVSTVYGVATGDISEDGLGDDEDLEVCIVDEEEAIRILIEEKLGVRTYYLLMMFIAGCK